MPKVKSHNIIAKERYAMIGNFFDVVTNLNSKKEIVSFFTGLLTPSEVIMMARRIQIAQLLIEERSYNFIKQKLKVSYQTITKTERWLHSENEKYDEWLKKCLRKRKGKGKTSSNFNGNNSLDRYSHHKFIKNLLK